MQVYLITHNVSVAIHTYGIYEGPQASSVGILVDGNLVPEAASSANDNDLINFLSVMVEVEYKEDSFTK